MFVYLVSTMRLISTKKGTDEVCIQARSHCTVQSNHIAVLVSLVPRLLPMYGKDPGYEDSILSQDTLHVTSLF